MIPPGRVLVPPRPNPGPEPLPQSSFNPYWLLALIPALVTLIAVWFYARKHRASRIRTVARRHSSGDFATIASPTPAAELMLRLAGSVRQDLIDRLGPVWRSRTTEELSVSPELLEVLGSEKLAELVQFLDQVDQLKFAPARLIPNHAETLDSDLERWQPAIDRLRASLSAYRPKPPSKKANSPRVTPASRGAASSRQFSESRTAPS